jgi:hypothetical protein
VSSWFQVSSAQEIGTTNSHEQNTNKARTQRRTKSINPNHLIYRVINPKHGKSNCTNRNYEFALGLELVSDQRVNREAMNIPSIEKVVRAEMRQNWQKAPIT